MIVRPLVSEKSYELVKQGLYTFEVVPGANKHAIAVLVGKKFGVDVMSVRIVNIPAKRKMQRARRRFYETGGLKKAIVQVKRGQRIALFEQIDKEAEDKKAEAVVTTAEGEQIANIREKKSMFGRTKVKIEKGSQADAKREVRDQETVQLKKRRQGEKKGDS